jgi:hypothetical protein
MTMSAHSQDYSKAAQHAQRLTHQELAQLVAELAALLAKQTAPQQQQAQEKPRKRHSITELKGLGKEIWAGVDVKEYINGERDSWDG